MYELLIMIPYIYIWIFVARRLLYLQKIKTFLNSVSFQNWVQHYIELITQKWIRSIFDTGNETNQAMNNEKWTTAPCRIQKYWTINCEPILYRLKKYKSRICLHEVSTLTEASCPHYMLSWSMYYFTFYFKTKIKPTKLINQLHHTLITTFWPRPSSGKSTHQPMEA